MLLGSGMLFGSSQPTARSYVQDGLIAHFDGIENAGYRVHDSSARTWKNLVSTGDLTLNTNVSFGDNCLRFPASGYSVPGAYNTALTTLATRQMEAVWVTDALNGQSYNEAMIVSSRFGGNNRYGLTMIGLNTAYFINYPRRFKCNTNSALGVPLALSVKFGGYSSANNLPEWAAIKNGTQALTMATDGTTLNSPSYLTLGGRASNIGNPSKIFYGRLFALRFYSRALTADEIKSNYKIDKERFGIS